MLLRKRKRAEKEKMGGLKERDPTGEVVVAAATVHTAANWPGASGRLHTTYTTTTTTTTTATTTL